MTDKERRRTEDRAAEIACSAIQAMDRALEQAGMQEGFADLPKQVARDLAEHADRLRALTDYQYRQQQARDTSRFKVAE